MSTDHLLFSIIILNIGDTRKLVSSYDTTSSHMQCSNCTRITIRVQFLQIKLPRCRNCVISLKRKINIAIGGCAYKRKARTTVLILFIAKLVFANLIAINRKQSQTLDEKSKNVLNFPQNPAKVNGMGTMLTFLQECNHFTTKELLVTHGQLGKIPTWLLLRDCVKNRYARNFSSLSIQILVNLLSSICWQYGIAITNDQSLINVPDRKLISFVANLMKALRSYKTSLESYQWRIL